MMTTDDLEELEGILYRETSVIAAEDVPLLMKVIYDTFLADVK